MPGVYPAQAGDSTTSSCRGRPTGYLVAHHGGNLGKEMTVFAGVAGSGINTLGDVWASNPVYPVGNLTGSRTDIWVEADNYARFEFEITPTRPVLYLAVDAEPDAINTVSDNSTISALIIVPEPTCLFCLVLGAGMLARRR